MIRCIIIDDEPPAVQLLRAYAEKIEDVHLLGTFTNPMEAWTFLQANSVDLVFLDVQMPELNGVQFAQLVGDKAAIVFTTAYPDYAVTGFELKALDYLVKPITLQRFLEAVGRQRELAQATPINTAESAPDFVFVKTEYRHQKVQLKDIQYLKGMGDYVAIYTSKEKILTLENMASFEQKLPERQFIRIHKSYIISWQQIEFIEKNRVVLAGERLPIGATYQQRFWDQVNSDQKS